MRSPAANAETRLSLWSHVRRYAVPPSMIESATARRLVGDWAGACAAARVDVDLDLRTVARTHGRDLAARVRDDLRHLAPDLLRWHLPRIAPDGLLRPGLTVALARYPLAAPGGVTPHLVVRTPPAWADAAQRISLALWSGTGPGTHPHPRPDRRFRLDLHRHLWDARRAGDLRHRCGADRLDAEAVVDADLVDPSGRVAADQRTAALADRGCAVGRWAAEATTLLRADGPGHGPVVVRLGARERLLLDVSPDGTRLRPAHPSAAPPGTPVLPDAATWLPPDLELLRRGLLDVERLHPLVAAALAPDRTRTPDAPVPGPVVTPVVCRGARHRIGVVDGLLTALDHDPAEIRREELLAALTGTPLPCLRAVDRAYRHPEGLADVRGRLDHGDTAGALAVVEALLGPDALLRAGDLRTELETAASRRVTYGLFRAGLAGWGPGRSDADHTRKRDRRGHPRHALAR
ncbi:hypothetical protein [Micromonospora cathayae]|uniref:Uncharacterized protein n=1 Tax=Micromonospora cathayae TaxID=3028804 RepID=A0ABY7ZP20_9ACTN|nr:hypothetical protein [Micromonospora sp. HUAS 3]WDZ83619.1 hypothetical protein PVK37_24610 [Micromonospora sp. HUAS 3]